MSESNKRQVVILAGGKGTRLAPFNTILPKPLMPLGDVSILEIVLRQLDCEGFGEAILATGHLSEIIEAFCRSLEPKLNLSLRIAHEEKPLGTIGPLKQIEGLEDDFLMMNGDVLTTLPYALVLDGHREKKALATLTVGERQIDLDFGLLEIDEEGSVVRYREKPSIRNMISYGVYAFSREILSWVPTEEAFDLPDLVQLLIDGNRRVDTFIYSGYWKDIGRFEDYEEAKKDFLAEPDKFLRTVD